MHRPKRKQEPLMLLQLAETTINVPHALQGQVELKLLVAHKMWTSDAPNGIL